jgi:hypothetical protein
MRLSSPVWAAAGVTKMIAAKPIQTLNRFVRNVFPPLAQLRRAVGRDPQAGKTLKMR